MRKWLSIDQCAEHGQYAVSIDDDESGIRLTPDKCCGRWVRIKAWPVNSSQLRAIADEALAAADELEANDGRS
jgi:hypothetical protein